jgi:transcriptional regulator with XRE-family HTH domain
MEKLKEDDMDQNKVGLFIQERRKFLNMTQSDLSRTLHVSDQAVSKWERGLNYPDIELISSLADLLKVSVSEILQGELSVSELKTEEAVKEALDYSSSVLKKEKKRFSKKIMVLRLVIALMVAGSLSLYYDAQHPTYTFIPMTSITQELFEKDYKDMEFLSTWQGCNESGGQVYTIHKQGLFGNGSNVEGLGFKFEPDSNKPSVFCPMTLEVNTQNKNLLNGMNAYKTGTLLKSVTLEVAVVLDNVPKITYTIYDHSNGSDDQTIQLMTRFTIEIWGFTINGSTQAVSVVSPKVGSAKRVVPDTYVSEIESNLTSLVQKIGFSQAISQDLDNLTTRFYRGYREFSGGEYGFIESRSSVLVNGEWMINQTFSSPNTIATFTYDQYGRRASVDIEREPSSSQIHGIFQVIEVVAFNRVQWFSTSGVDQWVFPSGYWDDISYRYTEVSTPWLIELTGSDMTIMCIEQYTHYRIQWPQLGIIS